MRIATLAQFNATLANIQDAEIDLAADPPAGAGQGRLGPQGIGARPGTNRPFPIDRFAHGVDDAAEPGFAREHRRLGFLHHRLAADTDAFQGAEGHGERPAIAETDDLAIDRTAAPRRDPAPAADRDFALHPADLDQHAEHGGHATVALDRRHASDLRQQFGHRTVWRQAAVARPSIGRFGNIHRPGTSAVALNDR